MVYLALWLVVVTDDQNCHSLCSKCALCTRTQALRCQRHWSIAASMTDWSNCTHSSIRRV